jgi:RNA polymerase sigma-70 factor (ECF subfamily)
MQNLSEEQLVCQARAGCSVSFGALVQRYRARLLRYLTGRLTYQDAEDVVQETLVRAYRRLETYDPARPFATWLLAIATRLAAGRSRAGRRELAVDDLDRADPSAAQPEQAVSQADQRQDLWEQAEGILPPKQHAAMWLRYGRAMSVKEIARSMGISSVHVKVLLFRARRRLLASQKFVARHGDAAGVDKTRGGR